MEIASGAERNPHVGLGLARTWSGYFHGRSINTGDGSSRLNPPGSASSRESAKSRCIKKKQKQDGKIMRNGQILPSAAAANPSRTDAVREKRSRTVRMKFFTSWLWQIVCPAVMLSRSPADADRGEGEPRGRKLECKNGREEARGRLTGL